MGYGGYTPRYPGLGAGLTLFQLLSKEYPSIIGLQTSPPLPCSSQENSANRVVWFPVTANSGTGIV